MKKTLLEWLKSDQEQQVDFDNDHNRLTINPKDDFVSIKYWEPKQIKGTDKYIWRRISEIKITPEFLEQHTKCNDLADFLYEKLLEGGQHEFSLKN